MIRTPLPAFAIGALLVPLLLTTPAAAQCDPAAELQAILTPYQQRVQELTANPTEANMAEVAALAEQLNGAGNKIAAGDTAGACADYADLRAKLGAN